VATAARTQLDKPEAAARCATRIRDPPPASPDGGERLSVGIGRGAASAEDGGAGGGHHVGPGVHRPRRCLPRHAGMVPRPAHR